MNDRAGRISKIASAIMAGRINPEDAGVKGLDTGSETGLKTALGALDEGEGQEGQLAKLEALL